MRIGHGFDVHKFSKMKKRPLFIGGVFIPNFDGLLAHSDGDVLIHALIDSLLGATALGDIGTIFPNSDQKIKNINSRTLLVLTWKKIKVKHFTIKNIDITLIAQIPIIKNYVKKMRINLAKDLESSISKINIKATTTENLGFIGRKEGIACQAVTLLNRKTCIYSSGSKH